MTEEHIFYIFITYLFILNILYQYSSSEI